MPPRYSPQLLGLDLSLHSDVFLLPDDLRGFLNMRRALPAASRKARKDEGRVRRVMLRLEALEPVLRWHNGEYKDWEWRVWREEVWPRTLLINSPATSLMGVFRGLLWLFPMCEELVVLVGDDKREVADVPLWSELRYVGPDDAGGVVEARCREVREVLGSIREEEDLGWPEVSFAFQTTL